MVCSVCGGPVEQGGRFCSRCGTQVVESPGAPGGGGAPMYSAPPQMAYPYPGQRMMLVPRVQRNLQALGILWCVYAAYRVMTALIGMFVLHMVATRAVFGPGWPFNHTFDGQTHGGFLEALVPVIAVATIFSVVLSLLTGFSLLNRKPWGRILAIVSAILALLKFPLGTALGIYTLWALAPEASGIEYDAIADRS